MSTKILVVEDNVVNAELALIVLQHQGFDPLIAPEADTALHILSENEDIPLALIDLHLPGMSGKDLAKKIRETNKTIKLVAFTASAMTADREQSLREGFDGYITKPISVSTIADTIRGILKNG